MDKPICYQLIGVPGSGKSTWIQKQLFKKIAVVSTDNHVEKYALSVGKTYSEVFKEFMPEAVKLMADDVVAAREANKNIIWDQTSTTVASRKRKFDMLPNYEHRAVVFETPPMDELIVRLNSRPGKIIPLDVVEIMILSFEPPTKEEGFTEIWNINWR